jgi:hypothetical protein
MKPQPQKPSGTPPWMWIAVIAVGLGAGFVLRPIIQGVRDGGTTIDTSTPSARCDGPSGSELALEEFVQGGLQTGSSVGSPVSYTRNYRLERPGQPALAFDAGSDATNTPISCDNVRFGPGARVAFGRGQEAVVVELVGPEVRPYRALQNPDLAKLVVDVRWKLGLKLEDYAARAPVLGEDGKVGRWTLERTTPTAGLPSRLVFDTTDGGVTYAFNQTESLAGL